MLLFLPCSHLLPVSFSSFLSFLLNSPAFTADICIAGICTFLPPLTRSSVSFFFYTSIILFLSLSLPHTHFSSSPSFSSNGLEHLLPLHPGGHFLKVKLLWHFYSVSPHLTPPTIVSPSSPGVSLAQAAQQHPATSFRWHAAAHAKHEHCNRCGHLQTIPSDVMLIWWLNHLITVQRTRKGKWQSKVM